MPEQRPSATGAPAPAPEQSSSEGGWWNRVTDTARQSQLLTPQRRPGSFAAQALNGPSFSPFSAQQPDTALERAQELAPSSIRTPADLATFLARIRAGHQQLDAEQEQFVSELEADLARMVQQGEANETLPPLTADRLARLHAMDAGLRAEQEGIQRREGQRFGPVDLSSIIDTDWAALGRRLASRDFWSDRGQDVQGILDAVPIYQMPAERQPRHTPDDIQAVRDGAQLSDEIVVTAHPTWMDLARGNLAAQQEGVAEAGDDLRNALSGYVQRALANQTEMRPGGAVSAQLVQDIEDLFRSFQRRGESHMRERDRLRTTAAITGDRNTAAEADRAALGGALPLLDYATIYTAPEFAFPGTMARGGAAIRSLGQAAASRIGSAGVSSFTPEQLAQLRAISAEPNNPFRLPSEIVEVGEARPRVPFQVGEAASPAPVDIRRTRPMSGIDYPTQPQPPRDPAALDAGQPNAGPASLEQLRAQGFNVDEPLFHGTQGDWEGQFRPSRALDLGNGVYVTPDAEFASAHAMKHPEGGNVIPVFARGGRFATEEEYLNAVANAGNGRSIGNGRTHDAAQAMLESQGYIGVRAGREVIVFRPENIARRHGEPAPASLGGGDAGARQVLEGDVILPRREIAPLAPPAAESFGARRRLTPEELFANRAAEIRAVLNKEGDPINHRAASQAAHAGIMDNLDRAQDAVRAGPSVSTGNAGNVADVRMLDEQLSADRRRLSIPSDDPDFPTGHIEYRPAADGWHIEDVHLEDNLRGRGMGVEMYEEMARHARAANVRRIFSGVRVTDEAQRVWSALERRGYAVTRNTEPGQPMFTLSLDDGGAGTRPRLPDGSAARTALSASERNTLEHLPAQITGGRPVAEFSAAGEGGGAAAARAAEAPSLAQRAGDWIKRTFGGRGESSNGGGMTLNAGVNPGRRTVRSGAMVPYSKQDPALHQALIERNALINSIREHYGRNPSGVGRWSATTPEGSAAHVAQILRGEAALPDGTFIQTPIPDATASLVRGVWKRTADLANAERAASAPEAAVDPYYVALGERLGISPERARALSARNGGVAADAAPEAVPGRRTDLPTMGYHATKENVQGPLREGMGSLGRGVYHSRDPRIAERFVANELGEFPEGANIVPERLPAIDRYVALDRVEDDLFRLATARGANMDDPAQVMALQDELLGYYQRRGFVGIHDPNYADGLGQMVTWEASNRRAPWARMEESARRSSDPLSAGIIPPRKTPVGNAVNNDIDELLGGEAGTAANAPAQTLNIPDDPAQWRDLVGQHPWINSPSRAQMIIMHEARNANGTGVYSVGDIAAATNQSEHSVPVLLHQARKAGVPLTPRLPGASSTQGPGGDIAARAIDLMERAARMGERLDQATMATRIGTTRASIKASLSRLRNGHVPNAESLRERLRALENKANAGNSTLQDLLPWLITTGGYFAALSTVADQGMKNEDPAIAAASRYTGRSESQPSQ